VSFWQMWRRRACGRMEEALGISGNNLAKTTRDMVLAPDIWDFFFLIFLSVNKYLQKKFKHEEKNIFLIWGVFFCFALPSVPDLTLGKVFKNFLPGKTLINCLFQTLPSVPHLTLGKVFDFF
jgi:hypothetical protein